MSQVKLRVPGATGEGANEEVLPVEELGPNRYRLLSAPLWVPGLAAEEVFELSEADPRGYRVLESGGNLCIWFRMPAEVAERHELVVDALDGGLEWIGGRLDGRAGWAFSFTLSAGVDRPIYAKAFDGAVARVPGSRWMIGNG
jgi:hypothetical protein